MLRVKGKGQGMISRTQTGMKSTAMSPPGIKCNAHSTSESGVNDEKQ